VLEYSTTTRGAKLFRALYRFLPPSGRLQHLVGVVNDDGIVRRTGRHEAQAQQGEQGCQSQDCGSLAH